MLFDVEKYRKAPARYDDMEPEELEFHDALDRDIIAVYRGDYERIEWYGLYDYHRRGGPRTIFPIVRIDMSGRISIDMRSRAKNDKILVSTDYIKRALESLIAFLSNCYDYGYLIPDSVEVANAADA